MWKLPPLTLYAFLSTYAGSARHILLSPAPRGPSRPQTRECGLFREIGYGQIDRFRFLQQIQPWSKARDFLWLIGLFGSRDSLGRLVRCTRSRYLVIGSNSVHAGLWSSAFSGNT